MESSHVGVWQIDVNGFETNQGWMEIDALKIKVRLSFVPSCTVSGLVSLVYMTMRQTLIGGSQVLTLMLS